jgi:RNA polymerase primary sigma factor
MDQEATGFTTYLAAIGNERLLSHAEEIILAQATQAGDTRARERLITANLRLVVAIAQHYAHQCDIPLEDLVQMGNIGLLHAAHRYDPALGNRFSTLAIWWIRQAITRAIADVGRLIRVPVYLQTSARKLRAAQASKQEVDIAELGISPTTLAHIAAIPKRLLSLDQPIGEEAETTLGDLLPAPEPGVVEQAETAALREALQQAFTRLNPREQCILSLRFGLETGTPLTLKQVGEHLGLTRERIRQVEVKALSKLRTADVAELVGEWLV